jgi:RNA polymerase sigma-70 factor (ECF subfamily)
MTDEQLQLQRLATGDETAYAAVFRTWYAPLVRFVDAMLRQRDEAEEVVQEVMLELWNRRAQLDPEQPVQAWLFRAARNRALNVVRHRNVRESTAPVVRELTAAPTPADATAATHEMQAAIHEAIAELPPRCREVFQLSRGEGLRNAQIAERLGISVKGVEAQMARALRALRERLRPWCPPGKTL